MFTLDWLHRCAHLIKFYQTSHCVFFLHTYYTLIKSTYTIFHIENGEVFGLKYSLFSIKHRFCLGLSDVLKHKTGTRVRHSPQVQKAKKLTNR